MSSTVNDTINEWLANLNAALQKNDSQQAAELFAPESYWRDFVSFTWNLKTMEGRKEIAEMLDATLESVKPANWTLEGDASEADGITEGWIKFETATSRGEGHLRLNADGQAWTLLTTAYELKGHEEARGATRPKGVEHGLFQGRKTWLENKQQEEAELGYKRQPYCVIIGGGQGWHRARCTPETAWRAHDHC